MFQFAACWFNDNKLALNVKKTNFMVFSSPRYNFVLIDQLLFDNNVIFLTALARYLGFINDSKLTWHYHILHVRDKVNKGLGILRRCSYLLPIDYLL